jgi:hypothetical protein
MDYYTAHKNWNLFERKRRGGGNCEAISDGKLTEIDRNWQKIDNFADKNCILFTQDMVLHSGTSSSKQPDIFFFCYFFFILNININLCDDACEEKKSILRLNGEHWSM